MDVKAIIVVQLPPYCRYHIIHVYPYIHDLPYNTISSHLICINGSLGATRVSLIQSNGGKCMG
jgi:hypothetical protein